MQAELSQTAKEFASVKKMQNTQKTEDMNTMESAAKNIKEVQEKEHEKSKRVIITQRIQFIGLDMNDFQQAEQDNMRLLRDFFIKWVGVDDPKNLIVSVARGPTHTDSGINSLLQLNGKASRRMRGRADLAVITSASGATSGSTFTDNGIIITVEISIAADRQGDIKSAIDLFEKIGSGDAASEIVIALKELYDEISHGLDPTGDSSHVKAHSLKAEMPTIHDVILDPHSSSSYGFKQTNATKIAEAASAGNLTDIGAAINAKDTPDIASAVEAQKLENLLSEETPRSPRPDQSLPGPPYPGAWGTTE